MKCYASKWLFPRYPATSSLWVRNKAWNLYRGLDRIKSVSSFFQKSPSRTPVLLFLALNFKIDVPSFNDLFTDNWVWLSTTKGSSLETHTYLFFFLEYSSAKSQTLQTNMPIHLLWGERNSIFYFHFSLTRLHILRMNKRSYLLAMSCWRGTTMTKLSLQCNTIDNCGSLGFKFQNPD